MLVKDKATGVTREIPDEHAAAEFAAGNVDLPAGTQLPVVSQDGDVGRVPVEKFMDGLRTGTWAPTTEGAVALAERKAGRGTMDQLAGVGLGLADTLSLGTAPGIAALVGGRNARENILGLREDVPWSVGGGQLAGALIPALGASKAVSKVGSPSLFRFTPGGRVAEGSMRLEAAVASRLGRGTGFLSGTGLAPTVIRRGISTGLAAGAEGAAYGAGHQFSEDMLADRKFSAESLAWGRSGELGGALGGMVTGAGFGAALGGLGAGVGYGFTKAGDATRSALGAATRRLENGEEGGLALSLLNRLEDKANTVGARSLGANTTHMREYNGFRAHRPEVASAIDDFSAGNMPFQNGQPMSKATAVDDAITWRADMGRRWDDAEAVLDAKAVTDPRYRVHMTPLDKAGNRVDDVWNVPMSRLDDAANTNASRQIDNLADIRLPGRAVNDDVSMQMGGLTRLDDAANTNAFRRVDDVVDLPTGAPANTNSFVGASDDPGLYAKIMAVADEVDQDLGQAALSKDIRALADEMLVKTVGGVGISKVRFWRKGIDGKISSWKNPSRADQAWMKVRGAMEDEAERIAANAPETAAEYAKLKAETAALRWVANAAEAGLAKQDGAGLFGGASMLGLMWGGPILGTAAALGRSTIRQYGDAVLAKGARWAAGAAKRRLSPRDAAITELAAKTEETRGAVNKYVDAFVGSMRSGARDLAKSKPSLQVPRAYIAASEPQEVTRSRALAIAEDVKAKQVDPELLLAGIGKLAGPLAEHAPETYAAYAAQVAAAYSVLSEYTPTTIKYDHLLASMDHKQMDPGSARRLVHVADAINNPMDVMRRLATTGDVTPEEINAIKRVYPSIFEMAQQRVMDGITSGEISPSYTEKVTLSLMFDVPASASMTPASIAAAQTAYFTDGQPGGATVPEFKTPKRPLDIASSMRTEIQINEAGGRFQ